MIPQRLLMGMQRATSPGVQATPTITLESRVDIQALNDMQAQTALPVIEERRRQVQQQLGQYGSHIGRFGREFVANTTELFEQVLPHV